MKKTAILERINLCDTLIQSLKERVEDISDENIVNTTTGACYVKSDIIRLRRELNDIRYGIEWDEKE